MYFVYVIIFVTDYFFFFSLQDVLYYSKINYLDYLLLFDSFLIPVKCLRGDYFSFETKNSKSVVKLIDKLIHI